MGSGESFSDNEGIKLYFSMSFKIEILCSVKHLLIVTILSNLSREKSAIFWMEMRDSFLHRQQLSVDEGLDTSLKHLNQADCN